MPLLTNVSGQAAGNGAIAIIECLLRSLIAKGVLTEDEVPKALRLLVSKKSLLLGTVEPLRCRFSAGARAVLLGLQAVA